MLGVNIDQVGWPTCGEIDIMENVGFDPNRSSPPSTPHAYNHVAGTAKGANRGRGAVGGLPRLRDRVVRRPDRLLRGRTRYFTFRNEHRARATWPFDKPHYLILNLAIGGTWGGQKGIDDAIFPQRYLIDYVRVYKQN